MELEMASLPKKEKSADAMNKKMFFRDLFLNWVVLAAEKLLNRELLLRKSLYLRSPCKTKRMLSVWMRWLSMFTIWAWIRMPGSHVRHAINTTKIDLRRFNGVLRSMRQYAKSERKIIHRGCVELCFEFNSVLHQKMRWSLNRNFSGREVFRNGLRP